MCIGPRIRQFTFCKIILKQGNLIGSKVLIPQTTQINFSLFGNIVFNLFNHSMFSIFIKIRNYISLVLFFKKGYAKVQSNNAKIISNHILLTGTLYTVTPAAPGSVKVVASLSLSKFPPSVN